MYVHTWLSTRTAPDLHCQDDIDRGGVRWQAWSLVAKHVSFDSALLVVRAVNTLTARLMKTSWLACSLNIHSKSPPKALDVSGVSPGV